MTTPEEKTKAINSARNFLLALTNHVESPGLPRMVRLQAKRILDTFPSEWDLEKIYKNGDTTILGDPSKL